MASNETTRPTGTRMNPSAGEIAALNSNPALSSPSSPYAMGLRFAWWGRVSTEDQQDPTLSLPRQLHNARAALPAGAIIAAHFYDIESGRKDLALRGQSLAHERFAIPIPRDGGIQDLLAAARSPNRGFDAVICESIERIARRTYYGTKIEHELETAGVALFAADEPIVLTGKRATTILTRRVKQGVAEWYVLETLEKAWDGFCEHTRQGWNVGSPPYGYLAEKIPHPVPARRAEGRTKTRLVPDPLRAPVVHQIFTWRVSERLGYGAIADRLNAHLSIYPVPTSLDPARQRDAWSRSSAREVLTNPKYTGYMVWNRRASKKGGKVNPRSDWVWSPEPTHEPLVTKELFDAAAAIAPTRQGSRNKAGPNVSHPDTKRVYRLRSFVICGTCGRRMFGKSRKQHSYYACQPKLNHAGKVDERFPDHPPSIWVREDALLAGVSSFFADRLFGPKRRELLAADIGELDHQAGRSHEAKLVATQRALTDIVSRQERLVRSLETQDDPDGTVFGRIRERLGELEALRLEQLHELSTLEKETGPRQDQNLLDQLPVLDVDLIDAPDEYLRPLFEAFRLEIRYDKTRHHATVRVAISDDTLDGLNERLMPSQNHSGHETASTKRPSDVSHLVCAPGRTRTCDARFRKPTLYPLSYGGNDW
jgi:site-specific DNA recombinase